MSNANPLPPEGLSAVRTLLPATALALIDVLGDEAALALLNRLPGQTLVVPMHPDRHPAAAKRWALLAGIVGEEGMVALSARWGGDVLDIPVCRAARDELKHRAIRAEFDRLTMIEGLSGRQAVYEIGLAFAPITSRAIELICGRADAGSPSDQPGLF